MTIAPNTVALEGNGARPSHKGDGYIQSDVMYTLNTTEVHAVSYKEAIICGAHGAMKPPERSTQTTSKAVESGKA